MQMHKNMNVYSENISPHCALVWLISKHRPNGKFETFTVLRSVAKQQPTQKLLFDHFEQFQAIFFTLPIPWFGVHRDSKKTQKSNNTR